MYLILEFSFHTCQAPSTGNEEGEFNMVDHRGVTGTPPRDFESLKAMRLGNHDSLPPRLVQLAAFALENPDEIALGTAASIAAQAAVQPSTLIRFAKRLGYSGFSDLQPGEAVTLRVIEGRRGRMAVQVASWETGLRR